MRLRWIAALMAVGVCSIAVAQDEPTVWDYHAPCEYYTDDLSPAVSEFWMRPDLACLEQVYADASEDEWAFTALATAPDGTLYAARPYTGEIFAFDDTDDEGLPDTPRVVASGLTPPGSADWITGLAWHDGALYAVGGVRIHRIDPENGDVDLITDALPDGTVSGGIAVDDDGTIYVSVGASDAATSIENAGRVYRILPDGTLETVASGLYYPADLIFDNGALIVTDTAPDALYALPNLDSVYRFDLTGTPPYFGFSGCSGVNIRDDCSGRAQSPLFTLPTGSVPFGIAAYPTNAIPLLTNTFILTLYGSNAQLDLRGYAIVAVRADGGIEPILPSNPAPQDPGYDGFDPQTINYRGSGFFPRRPLDVAVSADGIIYISVSGGRILSIRPYQVQSMPRPE